MSRRKALRKTSLLALLEKWPGTRPGSQSGLEQGQAGSSGQGQPVASGLEQGPVASQWPGKRPGSDHLPEKRQSFSSAWV